VIVRMGRADRTKNRARATGAVSACLCLALAAPSPVFAQALTSDLLAPVPGGFVQPENLPSRRPGNNSLQPRGTLQTSLLSPQRQDQSIITPPVPAASGAAGSGYDALNRKRQQVKYYPGQQRPKRPVGPGSLPPPLVQETRPVPPSAKAAKPPVAPAIAGAVIGQPARKRLPIDPDPYAPIGIRVGSFLVKGAVEIMGGYSDNPARLLQPRGASLYQIAPELLAASNWSRHSVVVDLRGSFTGYDKTFPSAIAQVSPSPENVDRAEFNGKIAGRIDATRDTRINTEARMRVGSDNPGSPNNTAGMKEFPLFTTTGGSLGIEQDFNRFQLKMDALVDRTVYQDSKLVNGITTPNTDRNFNQYGGVGRVSYEVLPGLKPFAEIQGDVRVHDERADRFTYLRDSSGGYIKAGTTFEFTRLLTGEASVGYLARKYEDPRLEVLKGLLTSASLVWTPTPLTTARFITTTTIDETTVPGVPGVLTRLYTVQVDHDFRRWLTAIGKFTYGTQDYQENFRSDKIYSIEGNLLYKMSREVWLKAQVRRDILNSNVVGASTAATVVMLGVRLQR
jgi:hypothetical protein